MPLPIHAPDRTKEQHELDSLTATAKSIEAHLAARTAKIKGMEGAELEAHQTWIEGQKTNLENVNKRIAELSNPPK